MIWPNVFVRSGVWLQNIRQGLYMRPDVYISSTRPSIFHTLLKFGNYLRRIRWSGNFIFLYFWKRTWVLKYTRAIRHRWKSRACYTGELLLPLRLWICARRSYFRKSFGKVISERSKVAPGYVMESQRLVFWWNEGTSESKELLAPIIDREIFFTQNK